MRANLPAGLGNSDPGRDRCVGIVSFGIGLLCKQNPLISKIDPEMSVVGVWAEEEAVPWSCRHLVDDLANRRDHTSLIVVRHPGMDWQGDDALAGTPGDRKLVGLQLIAVAPVWMKVERNEAGAAFDPTLCHQPDKFVTGDAE